MLRINDELVFTRNDIYEMTFLIVNEIASNSNFFGDMFDNYLQVQYGINQEQLKNIIKNIAPEEFI